MTDGGEVLAEELIGVGEGGTPRHSTALLEAVERTLGAAGGWGSVERIAVGLGPGSFVGIRIGVATARGLAMSTGLPVAGVCTLDALGLGMAATAGPARCRLALLDARRGEVFAALYGVGAERLWDPFVAPPAELARRLAELPAPALGAGSGAVRFRDELASRDVEIPGDSDPLHRVAARHVCALAGTPNGAAALDPIYLRPPDAQRWRERDTAERSG